MPAIDWLAAMPGQVGLGTNDDHAAGQALGHVVVGHALELERQAGGQEGPEALASRAAGHEVQGTADLVPRMGAGQRRSEGAIGRRQGDRDRRARAKPIGRSEQLQLDGRGRHGRRGCRRSARVRAPLRARLPAWRAEQGGHIDGQASRGRLQDGRGLADDLAQRSGADRGQLVTDVFGQGDDEPLDLLGGAGELGAQVLPLGGDAGRARVEVALPSHVAAERDEDGGPQRELLGAQQGGDDDVAAGAQAAVRAQHRAVAQAGAQQDLVDLGQAELPGHAGMLDGAERRGAGAARMTGHVHVVRARLDDAGGDGADAPRGDELDADAGGRVDRAKVGDELCQVLDGVDVVVRRRADVGHARLASAEGRDVGRRLAAGQMAAFAGLRALGDLDLELLRANEVGGGHAEARRGDLLDPRVTTLSVRSRRVPGRILPALAGVRGTAGALHADRHRLVRLGRERADAHGGGDEASADGPRGLDLDQRDPPATAIDERVAHDRGIAVAQPAQRPRIRPRPRSAPAVADRRRRWPGAPGPSPARSGAARRRPGSALVRGR